MRRLALLATGVLLAVLPAGAGARAGHQGAAGPGNVRRVSARALRPRAFGSCAALVRYGRRGLAITHGLAGRTVAPVSEPVAVSAPQASAGPAPAAAAPVQTSGDGTSFSTTNNQEQGIDEPDTVKTDGSTIFAVQGSAVRAVSVAGGAARLAGSLQLAGAGYGAQLLLRGSRLIVIGGAGAAPGPLALGAPARPAAAPAAGPAPASAPVPSFSGGQTIVTEVDVHDPAAMRVTRTMTIDGSFVDARQNGASARLVISSTPRAITQARSRASAGGWLPARRFRSALSGRRYVRPLASCTAVRRPAQFSGLGMMTLLTLDLDRGLWTADTTALMADPQVVYGSASSLYVATQKWIDPRTAPSQLPASQATVIDRFDLSAPDRTTFAASGQVPGYLLNQFSLSEYQGHLRVASTSRPIWWGGGRAPASQSYVTVLAQQGSLLSPVGQVSGLGAGQQIYSVRFLEDAGYVVTFRQVDPLYTIDLKVPTAPRVAGQLELQGYSAYLHPVGPGLLLGVGQDVGQGGPSGAPNEPSGAQLELFDVSNIAAPALLARTTLGGGSSSQVQYDHHAFLFWPPTGLALLPVQIYPVLPTPQPGGPSLPPASPPIAAARQAPSAGAGFVGAIGFRVSRSGIAEVGRIVHDASSGSLGPQITRSIVIGDRVFTISDAGVMASSLDQLARQAFVSFPSR